MERARTLATERIVRLEAPERPVVVIGDRDRLGQVLDNLLGNAVKYSPAGGEIVVRVASAATGGAPAAWPTGGRGSPPTCCRTCSSASTGGRTPREEAGLGLGLYISRMLVEAHGGRIGATSSPVREAPSPSRSPWSGAISSGLSRIGPSFRPFGQAQ